MPVLFYIGLQSQRFTNHGAFTCPFLCICTTRTPHTDIQGVNVPIITASVKNVVTEGLRDILNERSRTMCSETTIHIHKSAFFLVAKTFSFLLFGIGEYTQHKVFIKHQAETTV